MSHFSQYNFGGFAAEQFKRVEEVFKLNFTAGKETEGASFSAYYKGDLVVNLWAGYSDSAAIRRWKEDTLNVVFSATKAISSLCIALLVDREFLEYEEFVVKYWPEFGKFGKEQLTVQMVMEHKAGLAAIDTPITLEIMQDHEKMSALLENQQPNWEPASRSGYHATTFGWLVDQLVRRSDPLKRSIGQFFHEEIARPHEIDFYIGLPPELEHKVARLKAGTFKANVKEMFSNTKLFGLILFFYIPKPGSGLAKRVASNPPWASKNGIHLNSPEYHQIESAGVNGIGTAEGMAKLFSLLAQGKIISEKTLAKISKPSLIDQTDVVIGRLPLTKGWGFFFDKHPQPQQQDEWLFGHAGYGGSNVKVDLVNEMSFAYTSNGLHIGMGDMTPTFSALQAAIYKSIYSPFTDS